MESGTGRNKWSRAFEAGNFVVHIVVNDFKILFLYIGGEAVTHGFRSSFRDWASELRNPHAVMEAALARTLKNKAEAAYAGSDLFEKRRALMASWVQYLAR